MIVLMYYIPLIVSKLHRTVPARTTDKTVGYLDRSPWVGRWLVRERKDEDKASPLFSFSQILVLLLVINNSVLNIQPITNKSLWLGICTWITVLVFCLMSYYR
jgi:hypothetical protein